MPPAPPARHCASGIHPGAGCRVPGAGGGPETRRAPSKSALFAGGGPETRRPPALPAPPSFFRPHPIRRLAPTTASPPHLSRRSLPFPSLLFLARQFRAELCLLRAGRGLRDTIRAELCLLRAGRGLRDTIRAELCLFRARRGWGYEGIAARGGVAAEAGAGGGGVRRGGWTRRG